MSLGGHILWRPESARSANLLFISGTVASGSSSAVEVCTDPIPWVTFARLALPLVASQFSRLGLGGTATAGLLLDSPWTSPDSCVPTDTIALFKSYIVPALFLRKIECSRLHKHTSHRILLRLVLMDLP